MYWGRVSFGWGKIRQSWWRGSEGIRVICLILFEMKNWNCYELSSSTGGANLWYIYTIWCVEPVKEQTESGCGKVWLRNVGGVQRVVWISYCSGCTIGVSLQRFIWSGWHSLTADWWAYHMLVVLVRKEMGMACKRICRFWEGHRKVESWRPLWGSINFWFCDLFGGSCEGNQDWTRHHF